MSDDDSNPSIGETIRGLRLARGLSQENVAQALDISLKTVGRIEKEGRGHNLRRIRAFLEGLSATSDSTAVQSVRTFIDHESVPGGRPLALAFHELAALLDRLPIDQRGPAVQTFIDVQRRLDDGAFDPLKTLEAAAQVTVKAFAQFLRTPSR
jgi:transcriptional regulator with XRE-family HTH domain